MPCLTGISSGGLKEERTILPSIHCSLRCILKPVDMNLMIFDSGEVVHSMLEKLIYRLVGNRVKLSEEGSIGVNRATKMSYFLLTCIETQKC
ncbi:hypothetical protein BGX38DRAFT_1225118 [Terfezia claveryi]|nr:hypothetical protein BGX38DRAFT_1225118 [Terfezia claveryi]